jgi:hypothetical protein
MLCRHALFCIGSSTQCRMYRQGLLTICSGVDRLRPSLPHPSCIHKDPLCARSCSALSPSLIIWDYGSVFFTPSFPPLFCLIVNAVIFPHNSVHTFLQSLHLPVQSPFQNRLHFQGSFSQVTFHFPIITTLLWVPTNGRELRAEMIGLVIVSSTPSTHCSSTSSPSPSLPNEWRLHACIIVNNILDPKSNTNTYPPSFPIHPSGCPVYLVSSRYVASLPIVGVPSVSVSRLVLSFYPPPPCRGREG